MLSLNVKQITLKNALIVFLLLTHDLAGRAASAHQDFLGGGSTKDKDDGGGGKHLRVLSAPIQEGSEGIVLGSTSKNLDEVQVSDL